MQRTRFRNKLLKNHTEEKKLLYNEQKTFEKINEKDITDDWKFLQTVKTFSFG